MPERPAADPGALLNRGVILHPLPWEVFLAIDRPGND